MHSGCIRVALHADNLLSRLYLAETDKNVLLHGRISARLASSDASAARREPRFGSGMYDVSLRVFQGCSRGAMHKRSLPSTCCRWLGPTPSTYLVFILGSFE